MFLEGFHPESQQTAHQAGLGTATGLLLFLRLSMCLEWLQVAGVMFSCGITGFSWGNPDRKTLFIINFILFLPAIGFPCDVLACTKSGNDDLTWWHHGLSTKAPYMGYYCHLAVTKDPQPHEDAYLIDSIWIVDHHARWHQETSRNPCSQIISVDDITDEFWWPDISDDPWRLKMSWLPFVIASVPTSLMCAFILRPIFDYIYINIHLFDLHRLNSLMYKL